VRAAVVVLVLAAAPAPARAEPAEPADDIVGRPLVLDRYQIEARLTVEIDTFHYDVGKPTSLAPDVWVGVAPRWTVGVVHSFASVDRMDSGASFCVVMAQINPNGDACARVYRGSGLDARYLAWAHGEWAIAPRARLLVERDTDPDTGVVSPFEPALAIGALVRWRRGRLAIVADPYLQIGLAYRDRGNADALAVPFYVIVQPLRRWALWSEVGYYGKLDEGSDPINGWSGIFAVGSTVHAVRGLDVGVAFGFQGLFGPQNNSSASALYLVFGWRT